MTKKTRVDGRPVRCRVIAPSPNSTRPAPLGLPLLLLHGLGCSADVWSRALRRLARCGLARGVFAPDMPGYGHSAGPPKALDVDALADWTARLLDDLGVARAHVAGNSMGCQVALALARRHPERVGGLVLVGPTQGVVVPGWRYAVGTMMDGMREPILFAGVLPRMYLQMGAVRFIATLRKMLRDDTLGHARAVRAPCLVVRGGGDAIIPDASARRLAAALPRGTYVKIDGSAHAVQFNRPESFTQTTLAFLSGLEAVHGK